MPSLFACLGCNEFFEEEKNLLEHKCRFRPNISFINGTISLKRTKWGKFCDWFWGVDWPYWLAFFALVTINAIWQSHQTNWSWTERFVESICAGFCIPSLIRKR